jgi:hypothetical protein
VIYCMHRLSQLFLVIGKGKFFFYNMDFMGIKGVEFYVYFTQVTKCLYIQYTEV